MSNESTNSALYSFFRKWVQVSLTDLGIYDAKLAAYLADVLTRFARTEKLYVLRNLSGERLTTVVEMLLQAEGHAHPDSESFNPYFEREIRRHIGDYTLFMTGIFREYVQHLGVMDLYLTQGKDNYRLVGELDEMAERNDFDFFTYLARKFEHVSGGLHYMKQVYFTRERNLGSFDHLFGKIILS